MSNILRRPMFRGGKVDSRGTGITSGLDDRQNYDGGGQVMKRYAEILGQVQAQRPKFSLGDYLRIAATGAKIAGAPSRGGGIADALTAAADPLAELGGALAQSQDIKEAGDVKVASTLLGAELEKDLALQKIETESNLLKAKPYGRIVNEKASEYLEEGNTHQKKFNLGYGKGAAENIKYGVLILPYAVSYQDGNAIYTEDKNQINGGVVYFDPESQEYVVYNKDLSEAGSFPAGDVGRANAKKLASEVLTTKEVPTNTGDQPEIDKEDKVTGSYENPYEEDQDIFANATG